MPSSSIRTHSRDPGLKQITKGTRWLAFAGLVTSAVLFATIYAGGGEAATAPSLGTAGSFAVLGGSTVTNTGPTIVTGNLGVSPGSAITGFFPGTVTGPGQVIGETHSADAVALQAQSDATSAYNVLAGLPCPAFTTGDLGLQPPLVAGVYCYSSSAQLTGTLTLDGQGDPNAVFIFQIGSTLTTASGSSVSLINGAQSCNVFWQVGSSATLGTTTTFMGNILALASITLNTNAMVDGRVLAQTGAVTLDSNAISASSCAQAPTSTPTSAATSTPTVAIAATSTPTVAIAATSTPTVVIAATSVPTVAIAATSTPTIVIAATSTANAPTPVTTPMVVASTTPTGLVPQSPNIPLVPDVPLSPNIPLAPDVPQSPNIPLAPDVPQSPNIPLAPDVPQSPNIPLAPDVPQSPNIPLAPDVPQSPNIPLMPNVTATTAAPTSVSPGTTARSGTATPGAAASTGQVPGQPLPPANPVQNLPAAGTGPASEEANNVWFIAIALILSGSVLLLRSTRLSSKE